MNNCIACDSIETEEEQLVEVDNVGELCEGCYEDGITDSNMYLALLFP